MNLITAVLTKHARLRLHTVDCHTNVVGGLTLTEPATDLAVALAIASSYYDRPISPDLAAIGEIGEPPQTWLRQPASLSSPHVCMSSTALCTSGHGDQHMRVTVTSKACQASIALEGHCSCSAARALQA